ncbi:DNA sulfur modification protein DndC [Neobacillus bataviensis]|uniref:DNA sulfur modification protein DndC n=1 Tax=Neobacillus bataviensis TaxID=220685 RepID=A0A561CMK9_9BACI|nr:DNA phosphorothioation system sulfurtransferase DndC [Neobacillus bataviensis]TWD92197.1 DNA sulfur modification protein DndC [Neobacillus bataviensis]
MSFGIISNAISGQMPFVDEAKENIKKAYKEDDRPWVVGYSGGKDSTVVVQLVFEALNEMPKEELHKKVYVISSDTLVETPLIINSINQTLRRIQDEALKRDLPIETHKVKPVIQNSFWVNIIGKGYPTPNQQFRWCTDRLKIDPANQFIMDKVSSFGEVIMVLGVREDESQTRGNVIRSHSVDGKTFMRHSTLSNAYVYAPIRNFTLDDVWDYLLNHDSPWGDDNKELHRLYQDSNSGECPLVIDKNIKESAGSCGNSRFGCWVCTVVNEDKALTGFIASGHDWMKPLLDFRNWLTTIRDDRTKRMKYRKHGQVYYKEVKIEEIDDVKYVLIPKKASRAKQLIRFDEFVVVTKDELNDYISKHNIDLSSPEDHKILVSYDEVTLEGHVIKKYAQLGLGPYTMEARKEILTKLLEVQRDLTHPDDPHYELISREELKAIRKIWFKNGDWEDQIPTIYNEIMGYSLDWEMDDRPLFDKEQISDLELLADQFKVDIKVIKKLISIEKDYSGYKVRRGLMDEISKALKQDYLHL